MDAVMLELLQNVAYSDLILPYRGWEVYPYDRKVVSAEIALPC